MKLAVKKLFKSAATIIFGITVLLGITSCSACSDFGSYKYETNDYELNEEFSKILINTDTADIVFLPSADGVCRVECYEEKTQKHSVEIADGTLSINVVDNKKWYDYIELDFISPKIRVYLPKDEYTSLIINGDTGDTDIPNCFKFESIDVFVDTGDVKCWSSCSEAVKIETSTGDINISGMNAGLIKLSVSTGDISVSDTKCDGEVSIYVSIGDSVLENVTCKSLLSEGATGDITLNNVIASETFSIERSTGDVIFEGADAAEIFVKTSTGDVEGTLKSEKVFIVRTSTGDIDVPKTITGGRCEITTSTGDIEITTN